MQSKKLYLLILLPININFVTDSCVLMIKITLFQFF